MDRIIYTTMTGANAAAQRQAVLSNNLANVSTTGFRAELSTFRSVPLQGQGSSTRVFGLDATSGHLDQPGPAITTGKSTDLMARGNAWFAVQGLDGLEAYTRNGALEVTADGQLVTANGLPVLTDGGAPVDIPQNARVSFGGDGTVVATLDGQDPINIGRLKMVTPNQDQPLQRGDDGLFRNAQGDLPADANATVIAGALEGSNVNAVEAMVGMIAASRQFEQQMKLLTTAENNDKTASQLLSMNG
ncbi:flagellar basal-body rod protein FlgF [Comamonas sp. NoAH]|uniref:flagellar basal-body rod protein FlgF n=1 Tax=Comamonas halotolerans TaxID=3041496 RepID=UPI0024E100C8|nr:flagellar basal-body rod protein FlgF [Comamonas sp. NoAH]